MSFRRRIDMSRFFLPRHTRDQLLTNPPPLEESELPPAAVRFHPPFSKTCNGSIDFMLLAGAGRGWGGDDDKVIATDQTGRTVMYHAGSDSIRTLCNLTASKLAPVAFTAGGNINNLYILDNAFNPSRSRDHCFDALVYGDGDNGGGATWHVPRLALPPSAAAAVRAHPRSRIWVSKDSLGTHAFDVAAGVWSKAGDWALPFCGRAHHVEELGLWIGLNCEYGEESAVVAADLAAAAPPTRAIGVRWWEFPPLGWIVGSSHLVHLGSDRFCHARFFETRGRCGEGYRRKFVVFAGIEVVRRGDELFVIKHRSERYDIEYRLFQRVL
ncbi:unnamed protein product [Urochloa decumbens]|uniref:Uncharacterized protein n=1 Tax=Urochloa decumbens TaxID=240449 RepID=A0ABC9DTQ9_9POAL